MAVRAMAIVGFVYLCAAAAFCVAAELTTEAERTYQQLRAAKVARTQLLGERWNNLIRSQEWKSLDGKFVTTAKYVEHDPDLAWVKLRVIKGTGADRVVKDVTVPVAKLSKTCQSRVRQISVLTDKVAEAAVEAEAAKKADDEGREGEMPAADAADEMRGDGELGMGEMEAQGPPGRDGRRPPRGRGRPPINGPPPIDAASPEEPLPADTRPADAPPTDAVGSTTVERAPLPPRIPSLPSSDASASPATATDSTAAAAPAEGDGPPVVQAAATSTPAAAVPAEGDRPPTPRGVAADQPASQGEVPPAIMPDNAPWRTDYEAFRNHFTASAAASRDEPKSEWGEFDFLRQAKDLSWDLQELVDTNPASYKRLAELFQSMGEFSWEATLTDAEIGDDSSWTNRLDLPQLPGPIYLDLVLDNERGAGNWQALKAGDRVRFNGRFAAFEGEEILIVAIRFPENAVIESGASGEGR
jgi:hypothetical protein